MTSARSRFRKIKGILAIAAERLDADPVAPAHVHLALMQARRAVRLLENIQKSMRAR